MKPPGSYTKTFLITLLALIHLSFKANDTLSIYISPSGNDNNSGQITSPFRTIGRAQAYVKKIDKSRYAQIMVYLRGGVYHIVKPLLFTPDDGGKAGLTVEYTAYNNEVPLISGGKSLPKKWISADKARNLWRLNINDTSVDITQLFANEKRLSRSTSGIFYTTGPVASYAATVKQMGFYNFNDLIINKKRDLMPFCSFAYNGEDLDYLNNADLDDAEILLYHSWDCSRHGIFKIDKVYRSVYLKTPSYYNVGFFANKTRFAIENTTKDLKSPGEWCYSKKRGTLWYVSKPGENPNTLNFVIPAVNQLLIVKGDKLNDNCVYNLKFTHLNFAYTIAPRGYNTDRSFALAAKNEIPGLDLSTGFSGRQANFDCGQSIQLQSVKNVVISNCRFYNLGSYALSIDKYSDNNKVLNSTLSSLGGGGIILGYFRTDPLAEGIPPSAANNVISGCKIHDIGIVYQSSVGIALMNANNSTVSNNEIYNSAYSGISIGWVWGAGKSYTWANNILNNNIHNVLRLLADGGGIYTLGTQPNTIIKGNTIHDIYKNKDAIGAFNNALFFDQGSSGMSIEKNTSFNIQNQKVRFNKTDTSKMSWKTNSFK